MNRYDILLGKDATDSEIPVPGPFQTSQSDSSEKIVVVGAGNMDSAFQQLGEALSRVLMPDLIPAVPYPPVIGLFNYRVLPESPIILTPPDHREHASAQVIVMRYVRERIQEDEQRSSADRRKKRPESWKHGRKKDPWEI